MREPCAGEIEGSASCEREIAAIFAPGEGSTTGGCADTFDPRGEGERGWEGSARNEAVLFG
jgi:hypothetical protein